MSVDGPVESASVCETSSTWMLAGRPGIKPSLRAIRREDFPDPFLVPETESQLIVTLKKGRGREGRDAPAEQSVPDASLQPEVRVVQNLIATDSDRHSLEVDLL